MVQHEEVLEALRMLLNPNGEIRQQGESSLMQGMLVDGFGSALVDLSADQSLDSGLRQMALVVLRRMVKLRWSPIGLGDGPRVVPDSDKMYIRSRLPQWLGDPLSTIQTATGLVIAEIMMWESFQDWPELMPGLISIIQSDDSDSNFIRGALRAICLMIEDFDEIHVLELSSLVLPKLMELIRSDHASFVEKRQALTILNVTITSIHSMFKAVPQAKLLLDESIDKWFETVASVLQLPLNDSELDSWGQHLLLCNA